jgi:serine phosphatase RsbU (regulator of sigma subunit)
LKQLDTESNSSGTEALEVPVKTVTSSEVEKSTDSGLDSARPDIQLIEIKADKQPIGKTDNPKPFTTHEIELKPGMQFYLFTDGFADQFGGPKGKKFKYKQLEELLVSLSNSSMQEQKEALLSNFSQWKGDLEQVDDVCVIGVKV